MKWFLSLLRQGFPDAGFMLDHKNISGDYEYRERYWQPADLLWNASANTNAACYEKYGGGSASAGAGGESWKCLLSQYIAPLLTTPIFVMNSLHDLYQLTGGEGVGASIILLLFFQFPCEQGEHSPRQARSRHIGKLLC